MAVTVVAAMFADVVVVFSCMENRESTTVIKQSFLNVMKSCRGN